MKWHEHCLVLIVFVLAVSLCNSFVISKHFKSVELRKPQRHLPIIPTSFLADSLSNNDRIASSQHLSSFYNKLLLQYPYPTKMITSGVVGGIGDAIVQLLNCWSANRPLNLNFRRLSVFMTVATFYIAPIIHIWFNFLEKIKVPQFFGKVFGESKSIKPLFMLLLDQTLGAAIISAGFFYAFEITQTLLSQKSNLSVLLTALQAGHNINRRLLWRTLVINWYCWPVINFLNFRYIPIQYRLLASNIAAVLWNMFLSNMANSNV